MHTINWYPGHMAKARRMLEDNLKLVDMIIEIVDARAPMACRNPDFEALFKNKLRVVVLNKSDLSSKTQNRAWINYFAKQGITAAEFISTQPSTRKRAIELIEKTGRRPFGGIAKKALKKLCAQWSSAFRMSENPLSSIVLRARQGAQVGDRPGVTRSKQWVKVSDYLELLDTPGLLWGKLDNEILAKHLAYIGSIRDDVLDIEEISALLLFDLVRICPEALTARYKKLDPEQNIPELLLEGVCRSRGFILSGRVFDTERGARIVLDEYRAGKIAAVALENPTDNFEPQQAEQTDINNEKD